MQPRPPAANDPAIDPLIPTVFHERWWLDAITRGDWRAAEVHHQGRVLGWLPYVLSRRRGFAASVMPMLAHLLGPAIDIGAESGKAAWLRRFAIVRELVAQLPPVSFFSQTLHPEFGDVLAFQACGFESFVQFSAEVPPQDGDGQWSRMRDKTRNVIRRAEERFRVETIDPHELTRVYERNLQLSGQRSYFDTSLLAPLFESAASHHQGRILAARARDGRVAAAVFYVWDRRRLWYFLSTRDAQSADNGAVSLLVWHGMRMAVQRGLVFDFDGIASEGVARFYAGFGARFRPRHAVWRRSVACAVVDSAIDAVRGRSNRNTFVAP